jgi:hypothetical protein
MVSPEVAGDNRCGCVARGLAGHNQHAAPGRFRRISVENQLFGSTSITGKAIFFQALGRAKDGRARCAPSQSLDLAKLRVRLEAPVAFGERNEGRNQTNRTRDVIVIGRWYGAQPSQFAGGPTPVGRTRPADACVAFLLGQEAFSFTRTSSPDMWCHGASMSHCRIAICCPIYRSCGCRRCEIAGGSDACLLSRLSTTKIDLLEDSSRK